MFDGDSSGKDPGSIAWDIADTGTAGPEARSGEPGPGARAAAALLRLRPERVRRNVADFPCLRPGSRRRRRWRNVGYGRRRPGLPSPAPESISDRPRSASAIVGALVFALTMFGITDASITLMP